jgi:hypothetical protein
MPQKQNNQDNFDTRLASRPTPHSSYGTYTWATPLLTYSSHFRPVLLLVAFAICGGSMVALVSTAHGGTVDITSCASAAPNGADNAWQYLSDNANAFQEGPMICPPDGTQFGGITAWTKLNSGVASSSGEDAQLRFTAPTGTTISRIQLRRDIGTRDDGEYVYGRTETGQLTGETCTIPNGQFTCDVGGPLAAQADFSLTASWVAWGFQCGLNGFMSCGTGSTLHQAWATIYASTVTLTDNQAPTGVLVGGVLASGGWKGGTVAATASGADNLGIRTIRWYADGALVGGAGNSTTRACDFSTPVPCSDVSSVATSLNTGALTAGTRSVQLALVDPAGNESKSAAFSVQVDNTAPGAPSGLSVTGGGSSPTFGLAWTDPAADAGAPPATIQWNACSGSSCTSGSTPATGGTQRLDGLSLPASGTYVVRVWAIDQAGNGTTANAATGSVTYIAAAGGGGSAGGGGGGSGGGNGGGSGAGGSSGGGPGATGVAAPTAPSFPVTPTIPTAPPPTPAPANSAVKVTSAAISRRTGSLTVRGRLDRRAVGSVTITYRVQVAGRTKTRTITTRVRRGRYRATITLPAGWRASRAKGAKVTVRYAGSSAVRASRATVRVTR